MDQVFVYGTLMSGFSNNHLLSTPGSIYLGDGFMRFRGKMIAYCPAFPALVRCDGITPVHGEVYKASSNVMAALDMLEGYPGFYDRDILPCSIKGLGTDTEAWVYYVYPQDTNGAEEVIETGSWRDYVQLAG